MALTAADVTSMQATLTEAFLHRLVIQRATPGAASDYNQAARTFATLAIVQGQVIPKVPEEVALVSNAGAVIGTHKILVLPRDITERDRIVHDQSDCSLPDARDLADATFEIVGIRNTAGTGLNLAIDAVQMTPETA